MALGHRCCVKHLALDCGSVRLREMNVPLVDGRLLEPLLRI
jgi:hypothetical protein